jgi:hypothetical protein
MYVVQQEYRNVTFAKLHVPTWHALKILIKTQFPLNMILKDVKSNNLYSTVQHIFTKGNTIFLLKVFFHQFSAINNAWNTLKRTFMNESKGSYTLRNGKNNFEHTLIKNNSQKRKIISDWNC